MDIQSGCILVSANKYRKVVLDGKTFSGSIHNSLDLTVHFSKLILRSLYTILCSKAYLLS